MMPFRNFHQVCEYLNALGMFHMDLGLDRIRCVIQALNLERPPFVVVQVLGTNGKGSTCAFLDSICTSHGCRTGLYTSPHFVTPLERIQVDGKQVQEEIWLEFSNSILSATQGNRLTYFEFLTVLALLIFREAKVDVAIMEAGLGGKSDATTAISADLLCFAPIAMDHANILGPTLKHIAMDKACAIRSSAPICMARQFPEAKKVINETAKGYGADISSASELPPRWRKCLGLLGEHQADNAGLAITAWRNLAPLLQKNNDHIQALELGLGRAFLPGRLQLLARTAKHSALLLDGAHNPHGMQALLRAFPKGKTNSGCPFSSLSAIIFSCLGDKDWHNTAAMLRHRFPQTPMFVPNLNNPRAAHAKDVADFFRSIGQGPVMDLTGPNALEQAIAMASKHAQDDALTLMTGSLYLLAEFFARYPQYLETSSHLTSKEEIK